MFWKRKATLAAETPTAETMSVDNMAAVAEMLQEEPETTVMEVVPVAEPGVVPSFIAEAETEEPAKSGSGKAFFAGAVVGAGLGAAAALLFAPKSGEETRSELTEKGIELKNTVASKTAPTPDFKETFAGWKDTVTDTMPSGSEIKDTVKAWQSDAKAAVGDAKDSASDAAKDAVSNAKAAVGDAKDSASDAAKGAISDAKAAVGDAKDSASDAAKGAISDAKSTVSDAASSIHDDAKHALSDAKDAVEETKQEWEKKF